MMRTNPMLLIDFYKAVHAEMLPRGINKSVSYETARMSRIKRWNEIVSFIWQPICKTYLVDYFNENFFNRPFDEVISEYKRVMDAALGADNYKIDKIEKLHKLGYLPIEVRALPEGTRVPLHVPIMEISNTHPDFAWLPQSLESLISAESWHPMIAATVGYTYRQIVNKYYDLTCDDNIPRARALGAFDFRGEECTESAIKAGAGWCLSFLNTATVPVVPYLEAMYKAGRKDLMMDLIENVWGRLIDDGELCSPEYLPWIKCITKYKHPVMDSACHGSGAAPAYWLQILAKENGGKL